MRSRASSPRLGAGVPTPKKGGPTAQAEALREQNFNLTEGQA
jgi:hypothetical protein